MTRKTAPFVTVSLQNTRPRRRVERENTES